MFKAIKQRSAMKLKILSVYECDIKLLKIIRDSQAENLERLSIAYWHQPGSTLVAEEDKRLKDEDLNQIQMCLGGVRTQLTQPCLKKFTKLEMFNFCSTWFDFTVWKDVIDEQNDQALAITGNRDLEMIFFNLK